MLNRINKGQPAIWRDPTTLQIGLGPSSVSLEHISLEEQQIIDALYSGLVPGQEEALDSVIGSTPGTTRELIDRLGLVIENSPRKEIDVFGPWQDLAFAEIARASLDYEVNGEMVLAERWQRNIHIDQMDKTGWLLSRALLASGIGAIFSHDDGRILNTDLGELGYPREKLNQQRIAVAGQELSSFSLGKSDRARIVLLQSKPKEDVRFSFAVVVGHLALDPTRYARWSNRDVPHLAIVFGLESFEISPVIRPGITGCLNCYQQTKIDEDLSWPVLASQLLNHPRMRDDSSALLTSTGLAAKLTLRFLDLSAGFELKDGLMDLSYGYRVNQLDGSITRMSYAKHPECSCQLVG